MSVEVQIRKQIDHIGAYKEAIVAAIDGRDDLWDIVDAADNQGYENRVKGTNITALNDRLNTVDFGTQFSDWFRMHNEYFSADAGIDDVTNLTEAVDYYRWRVPQYFNDIMRGAVGSGMPVAQVFPRTDLVLGTWESSGLNTGTFTDGDSLEEDYASEGILETEVTTEIGSGDNLDINITCVREDDTTVVIAHTVTASASVGTRGKIGGQAITGNLTGGSSTSATMAATAQFKAGTRAILVEGTTTEIVTVDSISTNVSVTFEEAVRNSFTTSARLYPLFKGITQIAATGGTSGDGSVS